MSFVHLHVHTYYSILDGASSIDSHFKKAMEDKQPALAITDHGNMYGVKDFFKVAKKYPAIKPIIGCEVYVNPEGRFSKRGKEDQGANHLILLARNLNGYYNLVKLVSRGFTEGFYYKPKIDRELLTQYHENLICSSACLAGEIPQKLLNNDYEGAKESAKWFKDLFGEDYYLEVMLHRTEVPGQSLEVAEAQEKVNEGIFKLAAELDIKVIATNDVHFTRKEDGSAHDRLICLTTNTAINDPKRLRYTRQEYLKTEEEMRALFPEHPETIENTLEIASKIERYTIDRDHILPVFDLPDGFTDSNEYLKYLTYEGAKKRYREITPKIKERIDYELSTIKNMGFPDYFLIVQDFIMAARNMGVLVGPGRGSAAGSVVAYCLTITSIDPLKYDLLFERFLNPERISMPDIDTDFDDEGRAKVFQYVQRKYGADHVAHVVTFGTMAAKSAIKDIARIEEVPLAESDKLTSLIPDRFPSEKRKKKGPNGEDIEEEFTPKVTIPNCLERVPELKEAYDNSPIPNVSETLHFAEKLEGTIRNTGVHACAVIIGRDNLSEFIPICIAKDKETKEDMWVSQYEGSFIEDVGMLKMDFLGLKTLSIFKEALGNIKRHTGKSLDLDKIPIDDKKTYALFSRGDTVGTFQFESDGMKKWLRELKPNRFEDLIAMNALYRPGPMSYIPEFVARKNGKKPIVCDLPDMEDILSDTYGITVYQEQVMLISQKLAGFTGGQADGLRKAMGKKKIDKMMELKEKFMAGGTKNGHPKETLEKIWKDWTAFASYAFNKSHATCYAWVGYQTAYLKANYPAEFMAANLTNSINNISDITKFMDECKKMGISVLGPDINESDRTFTVNKKGNIRFGMAGIKGVGNAIVDNIVEGRQDEPYKNIFDFVERMSKAGNSINRNVMESLAYAGAFDSFSEIRREQFFSANSKGEIFIEALCTYGSRIQNDTLSQGNTLFGEEDEAFKPVPPEIPAPQEYNVLEFLNKEKELIGMYLSAHPLDTYKFEVNNFAQMTVSQVQEEIKIASETPGFKSKEIYIAGLVSSVSKKVSQKSGKPWMKFGIEDYTSTLYFSLFGKDYETFMSFVEAGQALFLKVCIQPRYFGKPASGNEKKEAKECECRVRRMTLLANTKDDFIRSFTISLPAGRINGDIRRNLTSLLKKNKGNHTLEIRLTDHEKRIAVEFQSMKYRIDVNNDLLEYLNDNDIKYTVDTRISL